MLCYIFSKTFRSICGYKKLCEIEELNNVERIFASDLVRAIASAKYLTENNNIKIECRRKIRRKKVWSK